MDSPEGTASLDPLDELLSVLDLTHLGEAHVRVEGVEGDEESDLGESVADVFVGESQKMPHGRVFGGQVLAQAVMAAGRTVHGVGHDSGRPIHSLHGYFVRPGDDSHPDPVRRRRDPRRPLLLDAARPGHPVRPADPLDDRLVPGAGRRA